MHRMLALSMLAVGLAGAGHAHALAAVESGTLVAGMRAPVALLWIVGPMLLAVVGAVTVGWRRGLKTDGERDGE